MNYLRERLLGYREDRSTFDDDEHQARRTATLFAIALIVIALGGLVFVLLRSDDSESDDRPAAQLSGDDIGPVPGTDLSTYIPERERALAGASGKRLAVVSFDQYVSEGDARAAVDSVAVTKLMAAAPGGSPSFVTGSLAAWAEEQVRASREERDELQKLMPTVDDPAFRDFYQAEINNLTAVVDRVKPDGPLLFGVVVRGDAKDLKELASRPGIRLVDVGRSARTSADALYRGLRPEETTTADEPATRPV